MRILSGCRLAGVRLRTRPPNRVVRWSRRIGIAALVLVVLVTGASLAFNLVTRPPETADPGFGRYVVVASGEVHYQRWGDHGTPIVLVPGAFEPSVVWSLVGPVLGKHHEVYALDLPGYGYTRYDGPLTLSGQAGVLAGFIAALGLKRPLVVGHSMGAAVAAKAALEDPGSMAGVVFADGDALPITLPPRWLRATILATPFATSAMRVAARWTSAVRNAIRSACGSPCPAATTDLARQWVAPLRQRSAEHALRGLLVNADYGLTAAALQSLTVPTSVIWGSDDDQGGSLPDTITNLHHPAAHTIANAGHLTMLADPGAFAAAVEDAARSIEGTRTSPVIPRM